jgi:hypothetical protein
MTPGPSATNLPHHLEPVVSPKANPPNLVSQGLGSSGETPLGGDSEEIPHEILHQWAPCVTDSLATNPAFIKVRFHIGRFITARVDTKKEHAITEALKCNLEFTSEQMKVSTSLLFHITFFCQF